MDGPGFRPPRIPQMGALSPQDEESFQAFWGMNPGVRQWRNSFVNSYGEQPRLDDPGYDYRKAYMAGPDEWPRAVNNDVVQHWGSAGKAPDHPTEWKAQFVQKFGVDPDAAGLSYTPEMQEFIRAGNVLPAFGMPRGLF